MKCKDYLGTYKCCQVLKLPWKDRLVDIDNCLVEEIKNLWSQGIKTVESCCGHHMANAGYIAVEEESIDKMIALGYEHQHNGKDFFKPKSDLKTKSKKLLKQISKGKATLNEARVDFELNSIDDELMNKKFTGLKENR